MLINVEEWAEIRRLHLGEGMAVKAIARRLGVAWNTVRAALRSDAAPSYAREGPGSAVDAFEPAIRRLLASSLAVLQADRSTDGRREVWMTSRYRVLRVGGGLFAGRSTGRPQRWSRLAWRSVARLRVRLGGCRGAC
jgi:hypothetical protein